MDAVDGGWVDNGDDDDDKGEFLLELSFNSTFKTLAWTESCTGPAELELFLVSAVGKEAVIWALVETLAVLSSWSLSLSVPISSMTILLRGFWGENRHLLYDRRWAISKLRWFSDTIPQQDSTASACGTDRFFSYPFSILNSWKPDSFYLLTPKSDKHLVSPYNITCDSHTKVTGIKQMIIK